MPFKMFRSMQMKTPSQLILYLLCLIFLPQCTPKGEKEEMKRLLDLPEIQEKGELTAVTLYSSTTYFQYKMQAMGYEYELIRDFARDAGLKLNILVAQTSTQMIDMLQTGEADIIAFPLHEDKSGKEIFRFCGLGEEQCQVLVQRAGRGKGRITDVSQLIGKDVYVKANTKYSTRLHHLDEELGGGIIIHDLEADSISVEDLIEQVAHGEIPYTIADEQLARLNRTYFGNINVSVRISFLQRSSWVVRKESPLLAEAIDLWTAEKKRKRTYKSLAKRYFERSKHPEDFIETPPVKDGAISPYDDLFRKYATRIGWDWQLLASISYQESHFNPNTISWTGAEGLMGIMPGTARRLGISAEKLSNPDTGIQTGVECLRRFRQGFSKVEDQEEKIKFTLAAYNAGIGHIYDAQKLAEKYGKNPNLWDGNVAEFIRLKNEPDYYNDPVCRHGYLRGSETFNYVNEIIDRYHYYLSQTTK